MANVEKIDLFFPDPLVLAVSLIRVGRFGSEVGTIVD
jgi:hypothetical protein